MSFPGQLTSITLELREIMKADPLLRNRKLRFGKVVNENLAESNFELRFEKELRTELADLLESSSDLTLSATYDYVTSDSGDNSGRKVIQISVSVRDSRRRELAKLIREVNNTGDIARILGQTLTPPDTLNFAERNLAVEHSQDHPSFQTHPQRSTAIIAPGQPRYAVELRKCIGGEGTPKPIEPVSREGSAFVELGLGDTYQVVLLNFDEQFDAVAKLEIDGLDAANTFNTDGVVYPGYFIPRAVGRNPGEHIVSGWLHTVRKTNDNVFQFVVNELGKGAVGAKNGRSSIGVINVQFFDASEPGEIMRGRKFGETGKGQGMQIDYKLKHVQVGSEPLSIISIRYNRSL
ncbi:MAG: hypothetical protein KDA89_24805 [Planctomycetaceae bacterium]|nr:hypothetical protein [Planctomycetaceae bacterium]